MNADTVSYYCSVTRSNCCCWKDAPFLGIETDSDADAASFIGEAKIDPSDFVNLRDLENFVRQTP